MEPVVQTRPAIHRDGISSGRVDEVDQIWHAFDSISRRLRLGLTYIRMRL